jgi:dTMP kinase
MIVFDGIDGCGKSTHARNTVDYLNSMGFEAIFLKEPTEESPAGKRLREALESGNRPSPEEELMLFIEDRKWDVEKRIKPALSQGKTVVLDRYYYSTVAYQGARGIDVDEIWEMNSFAPRPDIAFILDIEPDEAMKRLHRRSERDYFEEIEYLKEVRRIFLSMRDRKEVRMIDSSRHYEVVDRDIKEQLRSILYIP